jgi:hypothetical protein
MSHNNKAGKSKTSLIVSLIFALLIISVLFLFPALKKLGHNFGGYLEQMGKFDRALVNYLVDYYETNNSYPDNIDVSEFEIYQKHKDYRNVLEKVQYSRNGNSFKIHWKRPEFLIDHPSHFIILDIVGIDGNEPIINYSREKAYDISSKNN